MTEDLSESTEESEFVGEKVEEKFEDIQAE